MNRGTLCCLSSIYHLTSLITPSHHTASHLISSHGLWYSDSIHIYSHNNNNNIMKFFFYIINFCFCFSVFRVCCKPIAIIMIINDKNINNNNKNDKKLFNTIKGVSSFNIRCQLSHTVATVFTFMYSS